MVFLEIDDYYDHIFPSIREISYDDDAVKPSYEDNKNGISQLNCIITHIKNDEYYPGFLKKSAYLFVAISTGHYFFNGNKRLAMFSLVYFIAVNKLEWKKNSIEKYTNFFKKYFPKYNLSPNNFDSDIGWALYNLNKVINFKHLKPHKKRSYNFSELKRIVEKFLRFTVKLE